MNKIILILTGVFTVTTLVSAYCTKQTGGTEVERHEFEAYILAIKEMSIAVLKQLSFIYPERSHSVCGHQILTILGQLCGFTNRANREKILRVLKIKNEQKMIKILRTVLNRITDYKKLGEIRFSTIADIRNHFTTTYINIFTRLCDGKTYNTDFSNYHLSRSCLNQRFSDPGNRDLELEKYTFRRNGMMITSTLDYDLDFNHINNPTGTKLIDFHVNERTVLKKPAFYGNALLQYAEDLKLGTQIIRLSLNGDKCSLIVIMPNDPRNMPRVLQKYLNATEFDAAVKTMKPMCVKLTSCIGGAQMIHRMTPYLRNRGLLVNYYDNVFNNSKAYMNSILTEIYITPKEIKKRANINSPKCGGKCMREVIINKPLLYRYECDNIPVLYGVYSGQSYGDNH